MPYHFCFASAAPVSDTENNSMIHDERYCDYEYSQRFCTLVFHYYCRSTSTQVFPLSEGCVRFITCESFQVGRDWNRTEGGRGLPGSAEGGGDHVIGLQ